MSDLVWLSNAQMRRLEPFFPLSHGVPRVDDRRIVSGIVFVIRNAVRLCSGMPTESRQNRAFMPRRS